MRLHRSRPERDKGSEGNRQNLREQISHLQEKLDKLVSAYIDGDIPKESYPAKKEELLSQKVSLTKELEDLGQKRGKKKKVLPPNPKKQKT